MPRVALTDMRAGQEGVVKEVQSGHGLAKRLDAMGIRPEVRLTVTSGHYFRGPVTVRVGNAQVALGHGMAGKIIVEVAEEAE